MKYCIRCAVILVIFFNIFSCSRNSKNGVLKYTVIQEKNQSKTDTSAAVFKIMLDTNNFPSKEELKNTAIEIWRSEGQSKKLKVMLYLPGMETDAEAYTVVTFTRNGISSFTVRDYILNINKTTLKQAPEKVTQ